MVEGLEPISTTIPLIAGWNLVGYPANDDSTYNIGNLKTVTGATIVEGYSAAAPYRISELANSYILKRGEAYWIKVDSDTFWTVDW